MNRIFSYK